MFNERVKGEALGLIMGTKLGKGMSRQVFVCRLDTTTVIKIEKRSGYFQNVMEWETWQRVKDTDLSKFFAPCHYISPSGIILVQSRTTAAELKSYPDKIPMLFTDTKRRNWGIFQNKLVCHDYGTALITEHGLSKRLKKADWYD